jgi:hypothetical protein
MTESLNKTQTKQIIDDKLLWVAFEIFLLRPVQILLLLKSWSVCFSRFALLELSQLLQTNNLMVTIRLEVEVTDERSYVCHSQREVSK